MQHVCMKACVISGVAYAVGDAVPFEAVEESRRKRLVAMGIIDAAREAKHADARDAPSDTETPASNDVDDGGINHQADSENALNGVKKATRRKGR